MSNQESPPEPSDTEARFNDDHSFWTYRYEAARDEWQENFLKNDPEPVWEDYVPEPEDALKLTSNVHLQAGINIVNECNESLAKAARGGNNNG